MTKKMILPLLLAAGIAAGLLFYTGAVQLNDPPKDLYPVRGIDVSHYQGEIDWDVFSGQDIRFAYIKATEGSSARDENFAVNWANAAKTDLRAGAYHFFSAETGGQSQAENFLKTVSRVERMMPSAVDVEPYGNYKAEDFSDPGVMGELSVWLWMVEDHLGMKPVIYTTNRLYGSVRAAFPEYDVWIRSVYAAPSRDADWKLWQYSNRMKLNGYSGEEKFIDMNVFAGTEEEFEKYGYA